MNPVILLLCVGAAVALPAPQFVQQPNTNLPATEFVQQPNTNQQIGLRRRRDHYSQVSGQFLNDESTDSQVIQQKGILVPNHRNRKTVIEGGYHYNAPNGMRILVKYTADENGFHPTGDLIPKFV